VTAAIAGLLWWASTGADDTGWQPGELALFGRGGACPVCGGRHCAGCEAPARITANPHRHIARHDLAGTPPSILTTLALMTPTERARELTRQLGNRLYSPWRGLADRRTRVRLSAATIARRHGIPLWLGMAGPKGVLP
jgi:hypothetical protein